MFKIETTHKLNVTYVEQKLIRLISILRECTEASTSSQPYTRLFRIVSIQNKIFSSQTHTFINGLS